MLAKCRAKRRLTKKPDLVSRRQHQRRTDARLRRQARSRFSRILAAMPSPQDMELNAHGVELTDDVWVFDKQGRRVPPPAYAALSIDNLLCFQKDGNKPEC